MVLVPLDIALMFYTSGVSCDFRLLELCMLTRMYAAEQVRDMEIRT